MVLDISLLTHIYSVFLFLLLSNYNNDKSNSHMIDEKRLLTYQVLKYSIAPLQYHKDHNTITQQQDKETKTPIRSKPNTS